MAKYLDIFLDEERLLDPVLTLTEAHLQGADIYIDLGLRERGINPSDVSVPNAILAEIAINWAKRLAAIEGSLGDNSLLMDKANQYEKNAKGLIAKLSREALGIEAPAGTAFGQITIGRG